MNATGRAMLTTSLWDRRWMVRVSVGAEASERADVAVAWELMRSHAQVG